MKPPNSIQHRLSAGKAAVCLVMLAIWAGTVAVCAVPHFHSMLHQDAKSPGHHCVVSQVQAGSVWAGAGATVEAQRPCDGLTWIWNYEPRSLFRNEIRLCPTRGPPPAYAEGSAMFRRF